MAVKRKVAVGVVKGKPVPVKSSSSELPIMLRGLSQLYPTDLTRPGMVMAWIEERKSYYASFARYEKDGSKVILAKGYGSSVDAALDALLADWQTVSRSGQSLARLAIARKNAADQIATLNRKAAESIAQEVRRYTRRDFDPFLQD